MTTPQNNKPEVPTPLKSALDKIRGAWIAAFISAGITLVATIISIFSGPVLTIINPYAFVDVALIIVLAVLLIMFKSRIASSILFVYYISSQVLLRIHNPGAGGVVVALVFVLAYAGGVWGTFSYHKIKKQEQEDLPPPPPPPYYHNPYM